MFFPTLQLCLAVSITLKWTIKGTRDEDGNIILRISEDFTKCGTRIEQITELQFDENGIEKQVVTEYVVSTSTSV